MRVALRRTWVCIRATALIAVGGLVAHLAAASVEARKGKDTVELVPASGIPAGGEAAAIKPRAETSVPLPPIIITTDRDLQLAAKGMRAGSPVMIRIFKAESQLELWMQKDGRFELFATYPICYWSGKLGPKLHEGDKQAPEGLYSVGIDQIHHKGRWPRSLNIGYPNAFDRAYARTGSLILVHGGCKSTGCYAMTNPIMEEIYGLSEEALRRGQNAIPVHIFPFRMTDANLAAQADSVWYGFWQNLKEAYDLFERTRVPPKVSVCNRKYLVSAGTASEKPASSVCDEQEPSEIPVASVQTNVGGVKAARTRKAASKVHSRRLAGRNARKAYAAARRARMTAHAKRMRTSDAGPRRRSH